MWRPWCDCHLVVCNCAGGEGEEEHMNWNAVLPKVIVVGLSTSRWLLTRADLRMGMRSLELVNIAVGGSTRSKAAVCW